MEHIYNLGGPADQRIRPLHVVHQMTEHDKENKQSFQIVPVGAPRFYFRIRHFISLSISISMAYNSGVLPKSITLCQLHGSVL